MAYPGGSREKSYVRANLYHSIPYDMFYYKYHIVVASVICGDIQYLLEAGVSKDRIIACDMDPNALYVARKYGVIIPPRSYERDIVKTVHWADSEYGSHNIASINVDLCPTVQKMAKVLGCICECIDSTPKVFATFSYGRDKMNGDPCAPHLVRIDYLNNELSYLNVHVLRSYPYQSARLNNSGYPMCAVVLS